MAAFHSTDAPKDLVHGALILTPKPGLIDEIAASFSKFAEHVEANEPDTLVFSIAKSSPIKELGQDGPEKIVVTMIFKNQQALELHKNSEYNKTFTEKMKAADNLVDRPEAQSLTPAGGFMRKPPQ